MTQLICLGILIVFFAGLGVLLTVTQELGFIFGALPFSIAIVLLACIIVTWDDRKHSRTERS